MIGRSTCFWTLAERHFTLSATRSDTTDETVRLVGRRSLSGKCLCFVSIAIRTEKTVVRDGTQLSCRPNLFAEKRLICSAAVFPDQFLVVNLVMDRSRHRSIQRRSKAPHSTQHWHTVLRVITHGVKGFVRCEPCINSIALTFRQRRIEIAAHHCNETTRVRFSNTISFL